MSSSIPSTATDITLFFLGASRAIRIAWLLEELGLPYKVVSSPRAPNGLAPPEFKRQIPTALGKSPVIKDGEDVVVQESSAIAEYLCETYDTDGRFLPRDRRARAKVREWMAAAEGTFMIHGLAILYARWTMPAAAEASSALPEMERRLAVNVQNDLDWLESELSSSSSSSASSDGGKEYLVGNGVTAADIMMGFSVEFIFARKLGTETLIEDGKAKEWPRIRRWLKGVQSREAYRRAVEKTGYAL